MKKIFVVGSIAYDVIMNYPAYFLDQFHPEKLHQINVSFVVNKLEKQLGGTATNIAYNLSLVNKKTEIMPLAGVGKDGKEFMSFFKDQGIETKGLLFDTHLYTATGSVITDLKDNQIWGFYYGACEKGKDIDLSQHITPDSFIIISATHEKAFLHAQNYAITQKIPYLYDPGMSLSWVKMEDLQKGISNCRYLIGNDYEIAQIQRKLKITINELVSKGISVITTLGENGVTYEDKEQKYTIPGYKVTEVTDPTGAGDAWRGGFVGGIIEGKGITESLAQGNALASFAVECYGTVNHKPTKKDIEKRVQKIIKG